MVKLHDRWSYRNPTLLLTISIQSDLAKFPVSFLFTVPSFPNLTPKVEQLLCNLRRFYQHPGGMMAKVQRFLISSCTFMFLILSLLIFLINLQVSHRISPSISLCPIMAARHFSTMILLWEQKERLKSVDSSPLQSWLFSHFHPLIHATEELIKE